MSKKQKSNDDFESELKSEVQTFDAIAVGSIKQTDGTYKIIKVAIDSKNLEAGTIEVLDTAEFRAEANEKFKINVVRLGVI